LCMSNEPSPDPFTMPEPNGPSEPSSIPIVTDVPEQLPPDHAPTQEPI
jgi:hypothetical protein